MEYITVWGDYLAAYHFCLENGGQLFSGNGKDSANVVLIGKKCYTFWQKNSQRLIEVRQLAEHFGLNPEGQTGGRIARWLIDDLLQLPYQQTYWSKSYRNLAKKGAHWHYTTCDCKQYFWGVEIDIKSAYFSSLLKCKSLLYSPSIGYMADNNALENLKILYKDFPKWFRLQLLGCISSWRVFYQTRDKKSLENRELVVKTRQHIKYGAAFNVAHRAILRNYKIMQKIHEIGGKHIRRMHTDSFLLDIDIPDSIEFAIFDYLAEKGLQYSIKGYGYCYFWDLNTGFIGNKIVGAKSGVIDLMKQNNIKMKRANNNEETVKNLHYFSEAFKDNPSINSNVSDSNPPEYRQIEIDFT